MDGEEELEGGGEEAAKEGDRQEEDCNGEADSRADGVLAWRAGLDSGEVAEKVVTIFASSSIR